MEKILMAIDAIHPDKNTLDFTAYLGRLTKSKITGIFLENLVAEERPVLKQMQGSAYVDWELDENSAEHRAKMQLIEKNIAAFKESCITRSVNATVHRDRGVPAREIISESRFADLLVVDAETSFNKKYEGAPTEFVRDILKDAECPVVIAPETFDSINEIIFTYDGSKSSVFAIKQFTYLFPQLNKIRVTVLQVNSSEEEVNIDKYKFREWLRDHFDDMHFETLSGKTENELFKYLFKRKNIFIVMGAYGRNAISQFFKHSRADMVIKTVVAPIFIAHY